MCSGGDGAYDYEFRWINLLRFAAAKVAITCDRHGLSDVKRHCDSD